MATRRTGFDKRERDRAKKARAAAKREKRQDRGTTEHEDDPGDGTAAPAGDQAAVLDQLAKLHQDFEDEAIDFDTFEERKAELMTQLQVE